MAIFWTLGMILMLISPGLRAEMEQKPFWFQVPDMSAPKAEEKTPDQKSLLNFNANKVVPLNQDKEANPSSNLCFGFCERHPGVNWSVEWK